LLKYNYKTRCPACRQAGGAAHVFRYRVTKKPRYSVTERRNWWESDSHHSHQTWWESDSHQWV